MITINTRIDDLFLSELLPSVRAYNCCRLSGFETVLDLLAYYENNESFLRLRSCGKKTNIELAELCKMLESWGLNANSQEKKVNEAVNHSDSLKLKPVQGQELYYINGIYLETSIEQLHKDGLIQSIRCVNSCNNSRIYTLMDLLEYYCEKGSFLGIHNLGTKSNSELMAFVSPLIDEYKTKTARCYKQDVNCIDVDSRVSSIDKSDLELIVSEYCKNGSRDKSLFDGFVNSEGLFDINSRFGLQSVFDFHDFSLFVLSYLRRDDAVLKQFQGVYDSILYYHASFPSLLVDAVNKLSDNARTYVDVKGEMLLSKIGYTHRIRGIKSLVEFYFSNNGKDCGDAVVHNYLNGKIKTLFETISKLNQKGDSYVIKDLYDSLAINGCDYGFVAEFLFKNKKLPLFYLLECYCKSILSEYKKGITRGRLGDSRKLYKCVACAIYYGLGSERGCTEADVSRLLSVSRQTANNYIKEGIVRCAGLDCFDWNECYRFDVKNSSFLFETKKSLIMSIKEKEKLTSGEDALIKTFFAICDSVFFEFDGCRYILNFDKKEWSRYKIDKCINSIISLVDNKRIKDEVLVVEDLLPDKLNESQVGYLIEFVGFLLKENPNCNVYEGRLVLYKNYYKDMSELAQEVLEEVGTPMRADEILAKALEKEPAHKVTSIAQLKHYLYINEDIMSLGKSGLYALKKWGMESSTIRTCVIEFLRTKGEPQRIEDILEHVNNEFPNVTQHSLESSLKTAKSISFLGDKSYALIDKSYDYVKSNVSYNIFKLIEELSNFIQTNHAFPAAISNNADEEILHETWYDIIERINELAPDDRNAINEFKNMYEEYIPAD
jgi:hypothetical protein